MAGYNEFAMQQLMRPQASCPICDMSRQHEKGCPYEGISIAEAIKREKAKDAKEQDQEKASANPDET